MLDLKEGDENLVVGVSKGVDPVHRQSLEHDDSRVVQINKVSELKVEGKKIPTQRDQVWLNLFNLFFCR